MNLTDKLLKIKDEDYKKFSEKLTPETHYPVLGVRVPELRAIAKEAALKCEYSFLSEKHVYFEEFFLHGLIIAYAPLPKPEKLKYLLEFLPDIDNWAICDCVASSFKIFKADKDESFEFLLPLLSDGNPYTVRFAIACFLFHLVPECDEKIIAATRGINSDERCINAALGWLYCEMLVKDYDGVIPVLQSKTLSAAVQNAAIKKARESFRVRQEKKDYLLSLKK